MFFYVPEPRAWKATQPIFTPAIIRVLPPKEQSAQKKPQKIRSMKARQPYGMLTGAPVVNRSRRIRADLRVYATI